MRNPFTLLIAALAIVVASCGVTTPDAEISVEVPASTTQATAEPESIGFSTAEALRVAFINAVASGDLNSVEKILGDAQMAAGFIETLAPMMDGGVAMSAGDGDCAVSQPCYVFTDWQRAFVLEMESNSDGLWVMTRVNIESTD